MRRFRRIAAAAVVAVSTVVGALPAPTEASVVLPQVNAAPVWADGAPDPHVLYDNGTFYAFSTGTAVGNRIQVLINTTGNPLSGWRTTTGDQFGSTALAATPAWMVPDTSWAPSVFWSGSQWVMWYVGKRAGAQWCLSVATRATLAPTSTGAIFTDSTTTPVYCRDDLGGLLDPHAWVDPGSGNSYLYFKSNDGEQPGNALPSRVFAVQLNAAGTAFASGTAPVEILSNASGAPAWQTTYDNPQMFRLGNRYALLFSAGDFLNATYNEALASCAGPVGPCTPAAGPFLTSHAGAAGPGGGTLFADASGELWLAYHAYASCTTSNCSASTRRLWVAKTGLAHLDDFVTNLYVHLLGRNVDPGGLSTWLDVLIRSLDRPGQLASILTSSAEYRGRVVDRIYQQFFGRVPDAGGRAFWVNQMAAGLSASGLRQYILGSDEYFFTVGGTIPSYVDAVYQALLGRAPDAGGRAFWIGQLQAGVPRPQIGAALVGSDEANRLLVRAAYRTMLQRGTDPGGETYWAGRLQAGLDEIVLLAAIADLPEYFEKPATA